MPGSLGLNRRAEVSALTLARRSPEAARVPKPVIRRLRALAFDPSLATRLATASFNEITIAVPWEEPRSRARSASTSKSSTSTRRAASSTTRSTSTTRTCWRRDGLAPSESNPQFHQQMVYAVAMTTIQPLRAGARPQGAVGRSARAERATANTTGSSCAGCASTRTRCATATPTTRPPKKALLFGYFPVSLEGRGQHAGDDRLHLPLARHRRSRDDARPARRRSPALQRADEPPTSTPSTRRSPTSWRCSSTSRIPTVLESQIRRTRGDLDSENLLGQLAQQFGRATGRGAALRDALGGLDEATGSGSLARRTRTRSNRRSAHTTAAPSSWRRSSARSS